MTDSIFCIDKMYRCDATERYQSAYIAKNVAYRAKDVPHGECCWVAFQSIKPKFIFLCLCRAFQIMDGNSGRLKTLSTLLTHVTSVIGSICVSDRIADNLRTISESNIQWNFYKDETELQKLSECAWKAQKFLLLMFTLRWPECSPAPVIWN